MQRVGVCSKFEETNSVVVCSPGKRIGKIKMTKGTYVNQVNVVGSSGQPVAKPED